MKTITKKIMALSAVLLFSAALAISAFSDNGNGNNGNHGNGNNGNHGNGNNGNHGSGGNHGNGNNGGGNGSGNDDCIDESQICNDCFCILIYSPVCGCNGVTYSNSCFAENAGVTSYTPGPCQ